MFKILLQNARHWMGAAERAPRAPTIQAEPIGSYRIQMIARKGLAFPDVLSDQDIRLLCRTLLAQGSQHPGNEPGDRVSATSAQPALAAAPRPVFARPVAASEGAASRAAATALEPAPRRRYRLYSQAR